MQALSLYSDKLEMRGFGATDFLFCEFEHSSSYNQFQDQTR